MFACGARTGEGLVAGLTPTAVCFKSKRAAKRRLPEGVPFAGRPLRRLVTMGSEEESTPSPAVSNGSGSGGRMRAGRPLFLLAPCMGKRNCASGYSERQRFLPKYSQVRAGTPGHACLQLRVTKHSSAI